MSSCAIGPLLLVLLATGCVASDEKNSPETSSAGESPVAPYTAQVVLQPKEQARFVRLELTTESVLELPRSLHLDKRGVFWAHNSPPIIVFDPDGRFATTFGPQGNGPGEIGFVDALAVGQDGSSYVYDGNNRRVSIYDAKHEYVDSFPVEVDRLKQIAVNNRGVVYFLRENHYRGGAAVLAYNSQGTLLHSWGEIPNTAKVQLNIPGGGIEVDDVGNVYYGYISDHRIFKADSSGKLLSVFDAEPSYYKGPDENRLQKWDGKDASLEMERVKYFYGLSQMRGLFQVKRTPFLFQYFLTPDDKERRMKLSLELWHTDGFKIASDLKSPGELRFADERFLYFVDLNETFDENPQLRMHSYMLKREDSAVDR